MKDKKIFIILAILTGLIYIISLLLYITTKEVISLIFSAVSCILTIANLFTILYINREEPDNYKKYCKSDVKLTKNSYKKINKKHK